MKTYIVPKKVITNPMVLEDEDVIMMKADDAMQYITMLHTTIDTAIDTLKILADRTNPFVTANSIRDALLLEQQSRQVFDTYKGAVPIVKEEKEYFDAVYVCKYCGSDNVCQEHWINVNTNVVESQSGDSPLCFDCDDQTDLVKEDEYKPSPSTNDFLERADRESEATREDKI